MALASLPAGLISKRIGSRRALIIGYFFVAVGFCLLPLVEFLPECLKNIFQMEKKSNQIWNVGAVAMRQISFIQKDVCPALTVLGQNVHKDKYLVTY